MKHFLFLLAWVEGTDSADEATGVHSQDDLLPEYLKGNPAIFALEIKVPGGGNEEEIASKCGYAEAFHNNYTGLDSVSETVEIPGGYHHPGPIKSIVAGV